MCLSVPSILKSDRVVDHVPSPYIDEIVFGLILPCMEAASHLPQQPQLSFLSLTLSTVIAELRMTITNNKKLYRYMYVHRNIEGKDLIRRTFRKVIYVGGKQEATRSDTGTCTPIEISKGKKEPI